MTDGGEHSVAPQFNNASDGAKNSAVEDHPLFDGSRGS